MQIDCVFFRCGRRFAKRFEDGLERESATWIDAHGKENYPPPPLPCEEAVEPAGTITKFSWKSRMKLRSFLKACSSIAAASTLVPALLLSLSANARADELQVLAGGAMTGPLKELAGQFEKASGHNLVFRFGTTPELIKLATIGGSFDLAIVPREVFKDEAAQRQFAAGPTTDIARVGLGVAVRSGAPKPDIGTPAAFRQALLSAQSIATIPASAAGAQVLRTFETLGISDAMKAKTKVQPGPAQVVEAVARGEAELGVFLINVLTTPGLDVVGPFPDSLQQYVVFTSALGASTKKAEAANAFVTFLKTPGAAAVIKASGMTPS